MKTQSKAKHSKGPGRLAFSPRDFNLMQFAISRAHAQSYLVDAKYEPEGPLKKQLLGYAREWGKAAREHLATALRSRKYLGSKTSVTA